MNSLQNVKSVPVSEMGSKFTYMTASWHKHHYQHLDDHLNQSLQPTDYDAIGQTLFP